MCSAVGAAGVSIDGMSSSISKPLVGMCLPLEVARYHGDRVDRPY
jgi:hypothetical protein